MQFSALKFVAIFIVLLAMPLLFACNSSMYFSRQELSGGIVRYDITFKICLHEKGILDNSATLNQTDWHVVGYLEALGDKTGFKLVQNEVNAIFGPTIRTLSFKKLVYANAANPTAPLANITPTAGIVIAPPTVTRISRNPFFVRYKYDLPNPFLDYAIQFRHPPAGSLFHIFRYGLGEIFPSFFAAFPAANHTSFFNADNFTANFIMQTSARYRVYGDSIVQSGIGARNYTYIFKNDFSVCDYSNRIIFSALRPNPIGWYATAILLGLAVIAIAAKIIKTKLQKK